MFVNWFHKKGPPPEADPIEYSAVGCSKADAPALSTRSGHYDHSEPQSRTYTRQSLVLRPSPVRESTPPTEATQTLHPSQESDEFSDALAPIHQSLADLQETLRTVQRAVRANSCRSTEHFTQLVSQLGLIRYRMQTPLTAGGAPAVDRSSEIIAAIQSIPTHDSRFDHVFALQQRLLDTLAGVDLNSDKTMTALADIYEGVDSLYKEVGLLTEGSTSLPETFNRLDSACARRADRLESALLTKLKPMAETLDKILSTTRKPLGVRIAPARAPPRNVNRFDAPNHGTQAPPQSRGASAVATLASPPDDDPPPSDSDDSSVAGGGGGGGNGGRRPPRGPPPPHPPPVSDPHVSQRLVDIPPDLAQIILSRPELVTIRLIPRRARASVCAMFNSFARDLLYRTYREPQSLDRCAFAAAWRLLLSGRPCAADIRKRAALLVRGEYSTVYAEVLEHTKTPRRHRTDPSQQAKRKAQAGRMGVALERLAGGTPPIVERAALAQQLRTKLAHLHPSPNIPLPLPPAGANPPVEHSHVRMQIEREAGRVDDRSLGNTRPLAWQRHVRDLCLTLPLHSAPGPSGMRSEHLHLLSVVGSEGAEALAELVDMLCCGVVPPLLASGSLFGIPKADGGLRPIVAGEVVRKVAAKVALGELRSAAYAPLEADGQLALSTLGAHRVYSTVRDAIASGHCVASLDVTNAFNCIERTSVIQAVWALTGPTPDDPDPHLDRPDQGRALVEALNSKPTTLYLANAQAEPIVSSRGVAQGCPLSLLSFSITIARAVQAARRAMAEEGGDGEAVEVVFYADDGFVYSKSAAQVVRLVNHLRVALGAIGLSINTSKSVVVSPSEETPVALAEVGTPADKLGVMGGVLPALHHANPTEVVVNHAVKVLQEKANVSGAAVLFEDPQHAVGALGRAGMWTRSEYILVQTALSGHVGEEQIRDIAAAAETVDMAVLAETLGTFGGLLGPREWWQATLPIRLGGFGIPSPTLLVDTLHKKCQAIERSNVGDAGGARRLRDELKEERMDLNKAAFGTLMSTAEDGLDQARLTDLCGRNSGAFVRGCATASAERGTLLTRRTTEAALAWHLGMPVLGRYDGSAEPPCLKGDSCPHKTTMDARGRHAVGCGRLTSRHNLIRDVLHAVAAPVAQPGSLALEQRLEDVGNVPARHLAGSPAPPGSGNTQVETGPDLSRPGDVVYRLSQQPRKTYVDVSITGVRVGDNSSVRLASRAEADKRCQFRARYQPHAGEPRAASSGADGIHFVPFGMSTYGSFGPSAKAELSRLMHEYSTKGVELLAHSPHSPIEDTCQKLATMIYGQNGEAILDARSSLGTPDTRVANVARNSGLRKAIGERFRKEAARLREHGGSSTRAGAGSALAKRLLPGTIWPQAVQAPAGLQSGDAATSHVSGLSDTGTSACGPSTRSVVYWGEPHTVDLISAVVASARMTAPPVITTSSGLMDGSCILTHSNSAIVKKMQVRVVTNAMTRAAECARLALSVGLDVSSRDGLTTRRPLVAHVTSGASAHVVGGGAGADVGG